MTFILGHTLTVHMVLSLGSISYHTVIASSHEQFVFLSGSKLYFFLKKYTSLTKYFFKSLSNWSRCLYFYSTKVYPRYVFLDKRVVIYLLIHIKFLYKVKENSSRFHISPFYRNHILSVIYCF